MMESNAKILADIIWIEKPGDCSICRNCGDMIVSSKHVLAIQTNVAGRKETSETKIAFCNSCMELYNTE